MKKELRVLGSLIFVLVVFLFGCNGCKSCSSNAVPEEIISWDLYKTEYELGEPLDLNGEKENETSTIDVRYSNGEEKTIDVTYEMISMFDLLNVYGSIGTKKLKVVYEENGVKVSFDKDITVVVPATRLQAIQDIEGYKESTISAYSESNKARIDAIKSIARSAIYAAADYNQVVEIKDNTLAAIDTILVKAEEDAYEAAIAKMINDAKTSLNEKIDNLTSTTGAITALLNDKLSAYATVTELNNLNATITGDYNNKINTLKAQVDNITIPSVSAVAEVKYDSETKKISYKLIGGDWIELCTLTEGTVGAQGPEGQPGTPGAPGNDGKNVNLRVTGNLLQWQVEGADSWSDLFDLSALQGADGEDGSDGADGVDGTWVTGAAVDNNPESPTYGNLIITLNNADKIEAGNVLTDVSALETQITTLQDKLNYELDPSKNGSNDQPKSLQYQINDLYEKLNGLNISTTFQSLQDQLDDLNAFFANSDIDLTAAGNNLLNSLEILAVTKINDLLGTTYTLEGLKEKIDLVLPKLVAAFNARGVILEKGIQIKNIVTDSSLGMKEKLIALINVARDYDEVLSALGVSDERIAQIRNLLVTVKNTALTYIKSKLNAVIDLVLVDYLYDFDALIVSQPAVAAYEDEIRDYLEAIGYTNADKFVECKNNIKNLINSLELTNVLSVATQLFDEAQQLLLIDSMNEVIPGMLAVYIEKAYNTVIDKVKVAFDATAIAKITEAKDTYLMAILKSKSVLEAVKYAGYVEDAIYASTPIGELAVLVNDLSTEEKVSDAEAKVLAIKNMIYTNVKASRAAEINQAYIDANNTAYATLREGLRDRIATDHPELSVDQRNQLLAAALQSEEFLDAYDDACAQAKVTIDNAINDEIDDAIDNLYAALSTTDLRAAIIAARANLG